jgi:hypothetical protein
MATEIAARGPPREREGGGRHGERKVSHTTGTGALAIPSVLFTALGWVL